MWYTPLSNVIESGPSRWTRRCDAMEVDVDVAIVSAVTFHSTTIRRSFDISGGTALAWTSVSVCCTEMALRGRLVIVALTDSWKGNRSTNHTNFCIRQTRPYLDFSLPWASSDTHPYRRMHIYISAHHILIVIVCAYVHYAEGFELLLLLAGRKER